MNALVSLFLIVAGSPVATVGTYADMNACRAAMADSTARAVGNAPGFVYLCVNTNDPRITLPRN